MDEERKQSFYAPKKLFKKRIRESSESEDWSVFSSFVDSPSSIYANFLNDCSLSSPSTSAVGIDESLDLTTSKSFSTGFDDTNKEPVYTNLKSTPEVNFKLDFIGQEGVRDRNYFESLQDRNFLKPKSIDTSFIKTEVEDKSYYCNGHIDYSLNHTNGYNYSFNHSNGDNYSLNHSNGYNSPFVPKPQNFNKTYVESDTRALNLTVDSEDKKKRQQQQEEDIRKKVFEHESSFVKKFSLHESLKSHLSDEKTVARPIPLNVIKKKNENDSIFKSLLGFKLCEVKRERMETTIDSRSNVTNDVSMNHMSSSTQPFQNHISSTSFNFDSDSNSRVSPSQTVCDEDLNNLIDSEILKSSFPLDSVNVDTVTSSDGKGKGEGTEGSPQKKHGKKWMKGDMVCQVCGDKAAGFYCGAFACEACKKFFMRSCRNDKTKYVCLRDKKCQITAESRVQCQYCRLQKCLSLNMYSPGSDVRKENVGDIPCRVCSAPSSGFHFGALTCEGCKGFFRRMAKERELGKYRCTKSGSCEINTSTRNLCKTCRYQKCIDAGMSIEGSRIGRQPNAVKHAISLEVKNQLGPKTECDDKTGGFSLDDFNKSATQSEYESPESVQIKRPVRHDEENNGLPPHKILKMTPEITADYEETLRWIKECDKDLKVVQLPTVNRDNRVDGQPYATVKTLVEVDNRQGKSLSLESFRKKVCEKDMLTLNNVVEIWEEIVKPFYYHSSVIIKFAKKCQPFRKLPLEDQVKMLQQALYPVVVLNHSRDYVLETKQYSYFGWTVEEREHIWKYFPFYRILGEHFENTGDNVKLLGLDDDEFTILSALVLLNPDVPGLTEKDKVRQLQAEVLDFLERHLLIHYPEQPSRYGLILVRLSELNFYAYQHLEGIQEMLRVYPFLSMPQLYREMFINV